MTNVLRIDASMRREGSTTRRLTDQVIEKIESEGAVNLTTRDLSTGIEIIDEDWINANFTDAAERDAAQQFRLAKSDELVAELKNADVIVIGAPIYNFGVPAALKAWIDLIARARVTFRYSENGPVGMLEGKRAIVVLASGGTEMDSAIDYTTPYLRHVLGFVGIKDVTVVNSDRQMVDPAASEARAQNALATL
ncbi:MAG: NAD(P)H-dependent oxidoreductase [Pseudomonadota bacterium]